MKNIYVGNLSYQTSSSDLEQLFSRFGDVTRASVVSDRETGQSKGFGFVEMSNASEADSAISELNDQDHDGRKLKVNEARPREETPAGRAISPLVVRRQCGAPAFLVRHIQPNEGGPSTQWANRGS